jgi:hypothetical protein
MDIPTPNERTTTKFVTTVHVNELAQVQCATCNSTFFGPRAQRWYEAHTCRALTACQLGGTGEC